MNDQVRETLAELCRNNVLKTTSLLVQKPVHVCVKRKKDFNTACRLVGIEGLIWKDLRVTFGTRLAEAGCDAFTIAQLLGHSDVRVTMRYVRMVEERKRVAVGPLRSLQEKLGTYWSLQQNSRLCRRL